MRQTLQAFLSSQSVAGLALIAAAALAIWAANSSHAASYAGFLTFPLFHHTLSYWVNDALMAIFFLVVGLEIKQELLKGDLATWPQRLLPGFAALGGMLVPALIYLAINRHSPATLHGWAIPTATDIAFALGILALIPRVPVSLKIFLTALAILDDLGAILLIALFYTPSLALIPLALAGVLTIALFIFNKHKILSPLPYLATGILLWACIYQSGLHPVMAGVILALAIPSRSAPFLQQALHPYVSYAILPLFAFCNAGVSLTGISLANFTHPVTLGIFAGLFLGKQLGVGAAIWAAVKLFKIPAPLGASPLQLYAVTLLCGIGFTMSLFIGNLALPAALAPQIRLGILAASATSALLAIALLASTSRRRKPTTR